MAESGKNPFPYGSNAMKIMMKMGYTSGSGLGKDEQGSKDPIPVLTNRGRRGLGHSLMQLNEEWNFDSENCQVEEEFEWIENMKKDYDLEDMDFTNWIVKGPSKENVDNDTDFCDESVLKEVFQAKEIFDKLPESKLYEARKRANPFETIGASIFMNRAAVKMANIDAATNYMFTKVDENPLHHKAQGAYYFVDVCGGPGGFSEYILWRKMWRFKGFGFTLKNNLPFNLPNSKVVSSLNFYPNFGVRNDGDVFYPENLKSFTDTVQSETNGFGAHFMVADGGFSVKGKENLQEVLSKQLYLCQCLLGLMIVRPNGHFMTKVFDLFTTFSVGLVFFMFHCFDKITILKPNTSRPANSERYLICYGLRKNSLVDKIREHLWSVSCKMNAIKQTQNNKSLDINEIIPSTVVKSDDKFMEFLIASNNKLGRSQILHLKKLGVFCRNTKLSDQERQEKFRVRCLQHWKIPLKFECPWKKNSKNELDNIPDFVWEEPRILNSWEDLTESLKSVEGWSYVPLSYINMAHLYAGTAKSTTYRLRLEKGWTKVKEIPLFTGSLLYAELIKSDCSGSPNQTLQIIDATRVGDQEIGDLPYHRRLEVINSYCEAVYFKSKVFSTNIRTKLAHSLESIDLTNSGIQNSFSYYCASPYSPSLPKTDEQYRLNAMLLYRTTLDDNFESTYNSRLIVVLKKETASNPGDLTLKSFIGFVKDL